MLSPAIPFFNHVRFLTIDHPAQLPYFSRSSSDLVYWCPLLDRCSYNSVRLTATVLLWGLCWIFCSSLYMWLKYSCTHASSLSFCDCHNLPRAHFSPKTSSFHPPRHPPRNSTQLIVESWCTLYTPFITRRIPLHVGQYFYSVIVLRHQCADSQKIVRRSV